MINRYNFVEYCKDKIGNPYLYGFKQNYNFDIKCTKSDFKKLKKAYKELIWDSDINCVGKTPCDCSGLLSAYIGEQHSSTEFKKMSKIVDLNIKNLQKYDIGTLIWCQGHIGIVSKVGFKENLSDSFYIAEDGSNFGCREEKISKSHFTKLLIFPHIEYDKPLFRIVLAKRSKVYSDIYPKRKFLKYKDKNTILEIYNIFYCSNKLYGVTKKGNYIRLKGHNKIKC